MRDDVPRQPEFRPATARLNFRILALLWLPVSAGALFLLFQDTAWRHQATVPKAIAAVRIEQWLALLLLAVHAGIGWRAWCHSPSGSP
ncbi:MAG: hypothetical protein KF791_18820 [Verrucomicrobiae bacterium]|nr:hypothetical protein [Verrucomicrobiae bacterium]